MGVIQQIDFLSFPTPETAYVITTMLILYSRHSMAAKGGPIRYWSAPLLLTGKNIMPAKTLLHEYNLLSWLPIIHQLI